MTNLYICYSSFIQVYNPDLSINETIWSYGFGNMRPGDIFIYNANMWIADNQQGLVTRNNNYQYSSIYPNGPYSTDVYSMSSQGNEVWVAPGGRDLSWQNLWKSAKLFAIKDGFWSTVDNSNGTNPAMDTIWDILSVEINPFNHNQVYAGTYTYGLIEINSKTVTNVYNASNSSLQNIGGAVCRTGGVKFDSNGNLWVTNHGVNDILSVRINDGTR